MYMSKPMSFEEAIRQTKRLTVPEIDVSRQVMERIRALGEQEKPVRYDVPAGSSGISRYRYSPRVPAKAWIALLALLVVSTVSVGAAVLPLPAVWNGIRIALDLSGDGGANVTGGPTAKERIEQMVAQAGPDTPPLSPEQSRDELPFPILQPKETALRPSRSFGMIDSRQAGATAGTFYDFYEQERKWFVVVQQVDKPMTDSAQNPNITMSLTFVGDWEPVHVNDRTLALYRQAGDEALLTVRYTTADKQVIALECYGSGTKEELIGLAKSYLDNGS